MARTAPDKVTRGRLSAIDLMPPEADGIISWAAAELGLRERTQTDIYAEFVGKCEQLMAEHRGELEFAIPAFSSFNRYSIRLARLTRRLDETRQIVSALSASFDAKDSDDLTIMTAETIKALVLHMLGDSTDGIEPKDAMLLATAFKSAAQAQSISTDRRRKVEKEFESRIGTAVETVARAKGLTTETAEAIKAQILGVA
jgi:hypothetical protein